MTLKLSLSPNSYPWDTIYHTQDGQPLYRTGRRDLYTSVGNETFQISKVGQSAQENPRDVASIHLHALQPNEITINGATMKDKDFFRTKSGSVARGSVDRVWTGADGKEYRWVTRSSKPELYSNDRPETLIAKFHREHSGLFRRNTPASIEIFLDPVHDLPEDLLDMIVVTFVYVERIRADAERNTAGGMGEYAAFMP